MPWILLVTAGLLEIIWAIAMKESDGFTRLWPSVGSIVIGLISIALLTIAIRDLPMGTAYAVWTGIGAAGTAIIGILWFKDPASAARILCIAMIIGGVIGLKLTSENAP